ncbi:hypothetical protein [Mucilaginibacter pedocola]|uniref:Uncharacterized protein n=1 Tax=Mucilaginibacter pedocola TaxID=1792845 RepID=A0A1S9PEL5_9SPHI|nr:hypothetical protein [Mucilaginibacter pedocola]OOQ59390.1 hypothetical protein BC343_28280 [Mucilaginibacter pedocola]
MNKDLIKEYWKLYHESIIAIVVVVVTIGSYFWDSTYSILLLLYFSTYYFRYNAKVADVQRLKAKGLTQEDADNIQFVKRWEQSRNEGKLSYCLFDGAIVQGGILAVFLCLFAIATFGVQQLFAEPSGMFMVVGGGYLAGGIIAGAVHLLLWNRNEARFIRLTQFEHLIS